MKHEVPKVTSRQAGLIDVTSILETKRNPFSEELGITFKNAKIIYCDSLCKFLTKKNAFVIIIKKLIITKLHQLSYLGLKVNLEAFHGSSARVG